MSSVNPFQGAYIPVLNFLTAQGQHVSKNLPFKALFLFILEVKGFNDQDASTSFVLRQRKTFSRCTLLASYHFSLRGSIWPSARSPRVRFNGHRNKICELSTNDSSCCANHQCGGPRAHKDSKPKLSTPNPECFAGWDGHCSVNVERSNASAIAALPRSLGWMWSPGSKSSRIFAG